MGQRLSDNHCHLSHHLRHTRCCSVYLGVKQSFSDGCKDETLDPNELNLEFQILKFLLVSHRVTLMVTFGFLPLN